MSDLESLATRYARMETARRKSLTRLIVIVVADSGLSSSERAQALSLLAEYLPGAHEEIKRAQ